MPTNLGTFSNDHDLQCGKRGAAHRLGLSEIKLCLTLQSDCSDCNNVLLIEVCGILA